MNSVRRIKSGMLNALVTEPEKSPRSAIAQFVGTIVKHDTSKKNDAWMLQVMKFVFEQCSSSNPQQSEVSLPLTIVVKGISSIANLFRYSQVGSSVFATLTATAPDQFVTHIEAVCNMFSSALVATEQSGNLATPVILNILCGMCNLVPFILGNNNAEATYQKAIPYILKALQGFAVQDPDNFIKAFDILESMADYTPKLLNTHLKPLIDFCLEVANNGQLDEAVRNRAVSFIGWLIRIKKKAILKNGLIDPILHVVFNLMAIAPEDEDEDNDEEYYLDESSPKTSAMQTLDQLAIHVPPEKLIPPLLAILEPALKSDNPLFKKASYLCIAVIAEGCSESICSKYLRPLLDCVKIGITEANPIVRNAAFFALGQFSEYLQPEISKFAEEILPILFQYLQSICLEIRAGKTEPKHIDRMFYALETFCENLEDAIVPYLPALLERLFETLNPTNSVKLRELALSSVAATATAAKENMLPYFPQLIEGLKMYLVKTDNEEIAELRPQAIDTLATLARTIGKEHFMPLANDTMTFALTLLDESNNDEPELRTSLYNLLAALGEVVTVEMAAFLPKIVTRMLETVNNSEEVMATFNGDETNGALDKASLLSNNVVDEIDIENSEDEEDDEDILFSVENAYLDEKEEAILALKLLAEFTGPAFTTYIQPCFEAIYKRLEHPHMSIRKVSIDALTQFVESLFQLNDTEGTQKAVSIVIPKFAEILRGEDEIQVTIGVLEAFLSLLKKLKSFAVYNEDLRTQVFSSIQDVFNSKAACQFNDDAGEDGESEESEYFVALIEMAGDVLPRFGEALQPQEFALYFGRILPSILEKLNSNKDSEDFQSERSLAYGTLAESFQPLQGCTATWFENLLPHFLTGIQDEYEQARQNAVFGLGELILYSEEKGFEKFPQVLQALSQVVASEEHPGTLDNVCGAIARMVIANSDLIPLDQVLPVLVQKLPLREDFNENKTLFKAFSALLARNNPALFKVLERIILIGLGILARKEHTDDGKSFYLRSGRNNV